MNHVSVGDLFKIHKGKKVDGSGTVQKESFTRYLQIEDLRSDNKLKYCPTLGFEVSEKDILIAWDGAHAGIVSLGKQGVIGSTIAALRPLNDEVYSPYAARFLESLEQLIKSQRTGATIPHVSKQMLQNIKVPLPPLKEQRRIAKVLELADNLRRKCRKMQEELDTLAQSLFLDMVSIGHPNYQDWPIKQMEQLAMPEKGSMKTGPFGSSLKHDEFVDAGIAVLGIDNAVQNKFAWGKRRYITPEKYEVMKRYTVKPNDVIITIMGTTGRSAVVPEGVPTSISTKHLATITVNPQEATPEYISNSIHRDPTVLQQIQDQNHGAVMPGLNLGIIKELKLHVPPIEQQRKFNNAFAAIRAQEKQIQNKAQKIDNLFNSLLDQAFKGELVFNEAAFAALEKKLESSLE